MCSKPPFSGIFSWESMFLSILLKTFSFSFNSLAFNRPLQCKLSTLSTLIALYG